MVDLLLNRALSHKTVDLDGFVLSQPPRALAGLQVRRWIPVRIKDDDAVCAREVCAQPSRSRRHKKNMDVRVGVESVNHRLSLVDWRLAIHTHVRDAALPDALLDDVQHQLALREEQRFVAIGNHDLLQQVLGQLQLGRESRIPKVVARLVWKTLVQEVGVVANLAQNIDAVQGLASPVQYS
ncbi:hypothetical protein TOPH_02880 [Tolypocladium ophioglossoides CBS 100239]|uniref:Uncharacterized protein n=1 Tax=Tolypocladium ophioglossoides (strain CBS 100239) TaxID=1163406 RepID=A0A0L0NG54_TOLOC|nr:hypothetical protein TOPH_02880 [Tolypocladium ophioglossoides CBS 100239]